MKKLCLLVYIQVLFIAFTNGQVLCVQCIEQNEPVSTEVTDLIVNSGFEDTPCMPEWFGDSYCPNSNLYSCDIPHWVCTGGDELSYPGIFDSTLSVIPEGNYAAYFGNGNAFPCSSMFDDTLCFNRQSCIVQGIPAGFPRSNPGYGDATGVSLEQTVSGLISGNTYVLEFWAGGEPLHGLLLSDGLFAVDVGFGKIYLTCNSTHAEFFPTGTRYLIRFNATSESHTIKFTNWGHVCIDCTELVLDHVRLYAVEELSGSVPPCTTPTSAPVADPLFVLFPNPFDKNLYMGSGLSEPSEVTLYDCNAHRVLRSPFRNSTTLNTSHLKPGVYYYEIRDTRGTRRTGKIIKL